MIDSVVTAPFAVSVCLCTFKRPEGLRAALASIATQRLPAGVSLSIVVVDNDPAGSARALVKSFGSHHHELTVAYFVESCSGVSFARNRCLQEATGDWIAFIDDDETALEDWLLRLLEAAARFDAQAVFGPVLPQYAESAPSWMVNGGALERPRFPTGTIIGWGDARCGNVLMSRSLMSGVPAFDPEFARTGGEDSLYFARALKMGFRLVWCDEAIVSETVPASRMTTQWLLRRAFLGGRTFSRVQAAVHGRRVFVRWAIHGLAIVCVHLLPALWTWLFQRPFWMSHARKVAGGLGKIVAPFYGAGDYGGR